MVAVKATRQTSQPSGRPCNDGPPSKAAGPRSTASDASTSCEHKGRHFRSSSPHDNRIRSCPCHGKMIPRSYFGYIYSPVHYLPGLALIRIQQSHGKHGIVRPCLDRGKSTEQWPFTICVHSGSCMHIRQAGNSLIILEKNSSVSSVTSTKEPSLQCGNSHCSAFD